jgi:hypothetical protein
MLSRGSEECERWAARAGCALAELSMPCFVGGSETEALLKKHLMLHIKVLLVLTRTRTIPCRLPAKRRVFSEYSCAQRIFPDRPLRPYRRVAHTGTERCQASDVPDLVSAMVGEALDHWTTRHYDNFQRLTNNIAS